MSCRWRISEESRQVLVQTLGLSPGSESAIPSSLALSRFLTGFFSDCQHHMPIVHAGTFDIPTMCQLSPELVLAIAAVGAVHRFQEKAADLLYRAAQSLATMKAHRVNTRKGNDLHLMQTLILLEMYSLWEHATPVSLMTPTLQNLLLDCARCQLQPDAQEGDWVSWAVREAEIRLSIAAFCIFTVRSLFHHTPPLIAVNEAAKTLPSSTALWTAECTATWSSHYAVEPAPLDFRAAYRSLVTGDAEVAVSSPFGCFALLQAIMQRIDLSRRMSFDSSLRPTEIAEIE